MAIALFGMMVTGANPCADTPSIFSVATPSASSSGSCAGETGPTFTTDVILTDTLPTGAKVQYRSRWADTTGSPSGSWIDFPGGYVGTNDTLSDSYSGVMSEIGAGSANGYYDVEFRIVGTDGTTQCGSTSSGSQSWTNVDWCMA